MVKDVSEAEQWAIEFRTCNAIIKGMGLEEYELTMVEVEPIQATIKLMRKMLGWVDEDGAGLSS